MASLNPASAAAIARLRSYVPPPTTWHSLPLSRRAAVLILLFPDKKGDLRVVLTMRAATLKSYAGQAALPGGKSDTLSETATDTARREAWEEIGLPLGDGSDNQNSNQPASSIASQPNRKGPPPNLPYPFKLEHLCQLPANLAKTELGVRPCVALLYATSSVDKAQKPVDVESMLIPRLDAKEVAAVFTARFHNFLKAQDEVTLPPEPDPSKRDDGVWYKGQWTDWHETQFRMHNFFVPVRDQVVTKPKRTRGGNESSAMAEAIQRAGSESDQTDQTTWKGLHGKNRQAATSSTEKKGKGDGQYPRPSPTMPYSDIPHPEAPDPLDAMARFRVFGMTARILVDCARVAYEEEPEFEHNSHFGDEAIIERLLEMGRMDNERGKDDEFTTGELAKVVSGRGDSMGGVVTGRKKQKKDSSGSASSRL